MPIQLAGRIPQLAVFGFLLIVLVGVVLASNVVFNEDSEDLQVNTPNISPSQAGSDSGGFSVEKLKEEYLGESGDEGDLENGADSDDGSTSIDDDSCHLHLRIRIQKIMHHIKYYPTPTLGPLMATYTPTPTSSNQNNSSPQIHRYQILKLLQRLHLFLLRQVRQFPTNPKSWGQLFTPILRKWVW